MALEDLPTISKSAGTPELTSAYSRIAPAKINLALHVTGKRTDGYHLLESLVVFAEFGDRIAVTHAPSDRLEITGPFSAGIGDDVDNLVVRARAALRDRYREYAARTVCIRLEKNMPVASGIGGGSSDAAATLKALSALYNLDVDSDGLCDIGLTLGADVPMCVYGTPLVARGIGDRIEPVNNFPALDMVLINPGVSVATAAIFALLEKPVSQPLPRITEQLSFGAVLDFLASTQNDLQAPALDSAPQIGKALEAITQAGAAFARMSGSGATCFGLFERQDAAEKAAAAISRFHPDWFVRATRTRATADEQN